jgi:peptide/nickel transport system permease protein
VVQGVVLVVAVLYVVLNGAIDLLYGWLDPRIRRGAS